MKIIITAAGLDLTPSLKTYIEQKLGALRRFISKFDVGGVPEMRVEVARTTAHHHKGHVFRAEVSLRLPKAVLRVEREHEDVRTCVDEVRTTLKLEIEKYKTKTSPRTRSKRI